MVLCSCQLYRPYFLCFLLFVLKLVQFSPSKKTFHPVMILNHFSKADKRRNSEGCEQCEGFLFFYSLLWIVTVIYKFKNGHKTLKSTIKVVHATRVTFLKSFEGINPWHINRWNSIVLLRPIFSIIWFIKPNLNQTDLFWVSDSFAAFNSSVEEKIDSEYSYIYISVCF